MIGILLPRIPPLARAAICFAAALLVAASVISLPKTLVRGQEPAPPAATTSEASGDATAESVQQPASKSINIFELAVAGGIFMIPIAAMSILAVTMAIERSLALRRSRVLPDGLVRGLGELTQWSGGFDVQKGQKLCRQFPSPAAEVYRVMLSRAGSPPAEIEAAMTHAAQREADKLYGNIRWLNTAASLSTLLGLIGTIQGMIIAFHQLHTMGVAVERTSVLAAGIYTALVTTFAGLAVAIPTLLASNYFEGRIIKLFHEVEELGLEFLPRLASQDRPSRTASLEDNGDGAAGDVAAALPPKPAHLL
jgi:biopolymer transport protein ExbB